jgi:hypothetical protein
MNMQFHSLQHSRLHICLQLPMRDFASAKVRHTYIYSVGVKTNAQVLRHTPQGTSTLVENQLREAQSEEASISTT